MSCDIMALDLVDLPRLSHLSVPYTIGLPRGIGEMKLLRILTGFRLERASCQSCLSFGLAGTSTCESLAYCADALSSVSPPCGGSLE